MQKKLRDGVAIDVAFSSLEKKYSSHSDAHIDNTYFAQNSLAMSPQSITLKHRFLQCVKLGYGIIRPFTRPVMRRIKQYFMADILAELRNQAVTTAQGIAKLEVTLLRMQQIQQDVSAIKDYTHASARRVVIPTQDNQLLLKSRVGYLLCDASDHALVAVLVENGELETGTRMVFEKFLHAGDCFVDIGANIGMHTLAGAKKVGPTGKVIAFEPFARTKQLLERTIWINGCSDFVEIHEKAVSDVTGEQLLYLGQTSGHHSLYSFSSIGLSTCALVQTIRLDEAIDVTRKIDMLKIDAEGAELKILESASGIIKNNPDIAIVVEFGALHLKRTNVDPVAWLGAFAEYNLEYKVINESNGALESWSIEALCASESVNLFLSQPWSKAWQRMA